MKMRDCAKKGVEQVVARIAKRSASVGANTTCSFLGYQPKESK